MRKIFFSIGLMILLASCNTAAVPKPEKLIDEDKMIDIFYDLSLLEAVKSQNPYAPKNQSINPKEFIYKKYKIDSLQFAQSNQYYVSQVDNYKKMYEKVGQKLEKAKKKADSTFQSTTSIKGIPKTTDSEAPQVQ